LPHPYAYILFNRFTDIPKPGDKLDNNVKHLRGIIKSMPSAPVMIGAASCALYQRRYGTSPASSTKARQPHPRVGRLVLALGPKTIFVGGDGQDFRHSRLKDRPKTSLPQERLPGRQLNE